MFVNLSDTEGFCIVVAEAMLAGLPVIATDVGGVRDYGKDGENMLKLTVPSAEMAVTQALVFAGDETLRKKIGIQARQNMLQAILRPLCASALRRCWATDVRTGKGLATKITGPIVNSDGSASRPGPSPSPMPAHRPTNTVSTAVFLLS
ncbi:hypothetical protein AJ88_12825 [Mesorhizobium amorphae CCBAU 01583]|nr:hypothetical protein AJ88_12825 [Mesorhizobium amorphae CCBAU 01583]